MRFFTNTQSRCVSVVLTVSNISDKSVKLKALEERCLSPKSPSRVRGLEEDVSGEKRKENKVCKKLLIWPSGESMIFFT